MHIIGFALACIIWIILFIFNPKKVAIYLVSAGCNILYDRDEISHRELEEIQRIADKKNYIKDSEN